MPIREFEAWLIADQQALVTAFAGIETPRNPEAMKPREAKALLQSWIDASSPTGMTQRERAQRARQVRTDLAQRVSLEVLDGLSAWKLFRSDLRDSLASIP